MEFILGGLISLIAFALARKIKNPPMKSKVYNIDESDPSITRWLPVVSAEAVAAGVPVDFAMAYLAIESGGNPCEVGERSAVGPDGEPREVGLFQIYNPDDFEALKAKASELRTYCVKPAPGTPNPQRLSRKMTSDEMIRHVKLGIDNIKRQQRTADRFLTSNHVMWNPSGPDYWSFVKLVHGLPSIVNPGMSQVVVRLGRPPLSWKEFRATYEQVNPRAKFDQKKFDAGESQDGYFRALENAEWTGSHVTGDAIV